MQDKIKYTQTNIRIVIFKFYYDDRFSFKNAKFVYPECLSNRIFFSTNYKS